jgi:hypothetical protein
MARACRVRQHIPGLEAYAIAIGENAFGNENELSRIVAMFGTPGSRFDFHPVARPRTFLVVRQWNPEVAGNVRVADLQRTPILFANLVVASTGESREAN